MKLRKANNSQMDFGILGKVKIGEKHPEKGYPTSLDYFKFTPIQDKGNASYCEIADKLYPHTAQKKRNRLPIIFSSDSSDNFQNFMELIDHEGKVIARTDNETVEISETDIWKAWYLKNYERIKTPQKKKGYITLTNNDTEFGSTGQPLPPFEVFLKGVEDKAKEAAYKAKGGENGGKAAITAKEATKWVERLVIRFVLVNFPVLGRWELSTKGSASSIGNIVESYHSVLQAKGTVIGVQWELKIDKQKSSRQGVSRSYSVISLAPVITAQDVNSGQLLINSLNVHQNGLMLNSSSHHQPNPNGIVDAEFEE